MQKLNNKGSSGIQDVYIDTVNIFEIPNEVLKLLLEDCEEYIYNKIHNKSKIKRVRQNPP